MKEKNLREVLDKCSKEELVKTILRVAGQIYSISAWKEVIGEIRLDEIEAKINANLSEGRELTRKFSEMAKNPHNYTYDEITETRIALAKNHEKRKRLNSEYDKISKELYG